MLQDNVLKGEMRNHDYSKRGFTYLLGNEGISKLPPECCKSKVKILTLTLMIMIDITVIIEMFDLQTMMRTLALTLLIGFQMSANLLHVQLRLGMNYH